MNNDLILYVWYNMQLTRIEIKIFLTRIITVSGALIKILVFPSW